MTNGTQSGWSAESLQGGFSPAALDFNSNAGLVAPLSEPAFTPKFIRVTNMLSSCVPVLHLDARYNDIIGNVLNNSAFRAALRNGLVAAAAAVAETVDRKDHPHIYQGAVFIRNAMSLYSLYQTVKSNITVSGTNGNKELWNTIVSMNEGDQSSKIPYTIPELNERNWVLSDQCAISNGGIFFLDSSVLCLIKKLYDEHRSKLFSRGLFLGTKTAAEVVYTNIPRMSKSVGKNGESKFVMLEPFPTKVIIVTKFTNSPGDYWYAIHLVTLDLLERKESVTELSSTQSFNTALYICRKMPRTEDGNYDMTFSPSAGWGAIADSFINCVRFEDYDPSKDLIFRASTGMTILSGAMENVATTYGTLPRLSKDYDRIRDGIRRCTEKGYSRGYAFVGYPGTGKTVMMNQLLCDNPDVPKIRLDVYALCGNENGNYAYKNAITSMLCSLREIGYKSVIMYADDIDSFNMGEKNIHTVNFIDFCDRMKISVNNEIFPRVVMMYTINDPKNLHGSIMKRSKRIDEVIDVGMPDKDTIKVMLAHTKHEDDNTDYSAPEFDEVCAKMVEDSISIADISNLMDSINLYCTKGENGFSPEDLKAVEAKLIESKNNASTNYEL